MVKESEFIGSKIILGSRITSKYSTKRIDAKLSELKEDTDFIGIPSEKIGKHTAIIAQSGSGKSYFLGRLIEEIIIKTKANCLIFDPNSDFKKIFKTSDDLSSDASILQNLQYENFNWPSNKIKIFSNNVKADENNMALKIYWPSISVDFISQDVDFKTRIGLYYCHQFVQIMAPLFILKKEKTGEPIDLLNKSEELIEYTRKPDSDFQKLLMTDYNISELIKGKQDGFNDSYLLGMAFLCFGLLDFHHPLMPLDLGLIKLHEKFKSAIDTILRSLKYISPEIEILYFGKAREYKNAGIVRDIIDINLESNKINRENRIEVIDLPSLSNKTNQLLVINSILEMEWKRARNAWLDTIIKDESEDKRVPTFIIIDEAHNLIPAQTNNKAEDYLREQFRAIVAEGRKYGLFLIIASQRPDKIDPLILSECDNKCLMKISTKAVINIARERMGLEDISELNECLNFKLGDILQLGDWVDNNPTFIHCGVRRTAEGGRNLNHKYWATPYNS